MSFIFLFSVDYEKNDCTKSFTVNDINIYRLQSYPRQGINTGRDKCYNKFVGYNNKKLKIHVYEVKIGSCGIFLNIFDGDEQMRNDPRWTLGCRGAEKVVYESYTSEVIVRLDKPSSDSTSLYSFRIYITNVDGPAVDLSNPPTMSDGGGASSGVIVGIGIGVGLVVVVVVIVVAIVCWRMMNKKEKYASKSPAVFTTSTTRGDSVHFENTLGGTRSRNAMTASERSSTTNGYRSTSGSQRGRSSQHHDNNGYVSSNDSSVTTKKVSYNPIPIKPGDGAKFQTEKEVTTHRFTKRDGSIRKQTNSDHGKDVKLSPKKERPKDEVDSSVRVELLPKSKPSDTGHPVVRSSSEKRNTNKLKSATASRADTSSDTMSSMSDRRSKRDDKSRDDYHRDRSRDERYDERPKDSAARRSASYRESQSHDRRERTNSTRSRKNSTSRSSRPSYRDDYESDGHRHRSEQDYREKRRNEQYNSDYDSDHRSRRREKHDKSRGYDSDTRRRHHDYDSDRGGRDRSRHRYDQSDRYYNDYESDHGRRRDSSRRRRQNSDRNYRDYDSDDNSYRSNRRRSQRHDNRDRYYSDEDLVDSRRRRTESLSRKSRPRSQSYSRSGTSRR
ncbi:serine/threonine-protein kinase fray2-like [Argopecten irradians]|uniref:serine/threonine-protein kinase fray2-like n=1 Tax=Argopecten irradians TaxID=31199 RepID=UPI00371E6051